MSAKKSIKSFNINSQWKRFLAVGCSHGYLINKEVEKDVLGFADRFKPDTCVHLGDFLDTTALRSGAIGTNDESAPIDHDINEGCRFLKMLRPNIVLCGNHELRIWTLAKSRKSMVSSLALSIIRTINDVTTSIGSELHLYKGLWTMRKFRNYQLAHGYLYSENCCRDHAESHGNIIFAHAHRAGMANGRRDDDALGICVGTLSDIPNMDYANCRRATLGWSHGFVFGEYNDKILQPYLCQKEKMTTQWRLPM